MLASISNKPENYFFKDSNEIKKRLKILSNRFCWFCSVKCSEYVSICSDCKNKKIKK